MTVVCPTFVRTEIFAGPLIDERSARFAAGVARYVGTSPRTVARATLDAHERGHLYCMPQLDARGMWLAKRLAPTVSARAGGLLALIAPSSTTTSGGKT